MIGIAKGRVTHLMLLLALGLIACGGRQGEGVPSVASVPAQATVAKSRSAEFWRWFSEHATELRETTDLRVVMETISAQLEKAYPGVFAEIGEDGDQLLLVISADGNKQLFPEVQEVYVARPTLPGWKIVAFRQRDSSFAIEIGGRKLEPKALKFVGTADAGKLDIDLFLPGYKADDEELGRLGFIVLDHVIGEYDMETKIGGIAFAALEVAPATARPLTELPAMVDAIK